MTIKKGNTVFFKDKTSNLIKKGIAENLVFDSDDRKYYDIRGTGDMMKSFSGLKTLYSEDVFLSYENCLNSIRNTDDKIVKNYENEINNIHDLVKFVFEHPCSNAEQYTDYNAAQAARNKALELLNLKL